MVSGQFSVPSTRECSMLRNKIEVKKDKQQSQQSQQSRQCRQSVWMKGHLLLNTNYLFCENMKKMT